MTRKATPFSRHLRRGGFLREDGPYACGIVMMQDPILREFLEKINPLRKHITRMILFGSRARGDDRTDSDYDLLIVVPRKDDDLLDGLYEGVMDVLLAHGRLISLKIFPEGEFERLTRLQTPFMQRVKAEGVPLG